MVYLLNKTSLCFLPLFINKMHWLSHRTVKTIKVWIIIKVRGAKRVVLPFLSLFFVEIIVLYKSVYAFSLCIYIILFAAITGICYRFIRITSIKFFVLFNMINISCCIRCCLMCTEVSYELFIGRYLYIVSRF